MDGARCIRLSGVKKEAGWVQWPPTLKAKNAFRMGHPQPGGRDAASTAGWEAGATNGCCKPVLRTEFTKVQLLAVEGALEDDF